MSIQHRYRLKNIGEFISQFVNDSSGSIAAPAFAAIALFIFLAGTTYDYSFAQARHAQVAELADQAALQAATEAGKAYLGNNETAAIAKGIEAGNQWFDKLFQNGKLNGTFSQTTILKRAISISRVNGAFSATTQVQSQVKSVFFAIPGDSFYEFNDSPTAIYGKATYTDIYLALDKSASMGLPSTAAGMQTMQKLTGCQFVCHSPGEDNVPIARKNGVEMRLDVMKRYARLLVEKLSKSQSSWATPDQNRVAVYAFDETPIVSAPSDLFSQVTRKIDAIDLGEGTSYGALFDRLESDMGENGKGSSGDDRKKVLIFVTDGVEGIIHSRWPWDQMKIIRRWGPFLANYADVGPWPQQTPIGTSRGTSILNLNNCTALKNKGIRIMVIDLIYIPFSPQQPNYETYKNFVGYMAFNISPTLRECASLGDYFSATTPGDIETAFDQVFASLSNTVRLSK